MGPLRHIADLGRIFVVFACGALISFGGAYAAPRVDAFGTVTGTPATVTSKPQKSPASVAPTTSNTVAPVAITQPASNSSPGRISRPLPSDRPVNALPRQDDPCWSKANYKGCSEGQKIDAWIKHLEISPPTSRGNYCWKLADGICWTKFSIPDGKGGTRTVDVACKAGGGPALPGQIENLVYELKKSKAIFLAGGYDPQNNHDANPRSGRQH